MIVQKDAVITANMCNKYNDSGIFIVEAIPMNYKAESTSKKVLKVALKDSTKA